MANTNKCELLDYEWWRPDYTDEDAENEMSDYDADLSLRDLTLAEVELDEWQSEHHRNQ